MKSKKTHKDKNTFNENTTRQRLISDCIIRFGPEGGRQLKMLFEKWDKLMAKCKNESELNHIGALACAEIYSAMGYGGGLTVDGEVMIPNEDRNPKRIGDA